MEMMLWNAALSFVVGVMGFLLRDKFEALSELGKLLNKTREEIARDHITRKEVRDDMEKIMERFDAGIQKLENKLDELHRNRRGE